MRRSIQSTLPKAAACQAVVIWIDWYAYHLARFEGLQSAFGYNGEVVGIEWVGGIGVHAGLKFREDRQANLPIETLMPTSSWRTANKLSLARKTWQRLSQLGPQIVLVPGYYILPAIAAAAWAKLHNRKSVLMAESTAFDHPRKGWKEKLKSLTIRLLFDWAVVGGTAHRQYLTQLGFPTDRIANFYDVVGNDDIRNKTAAIRAFTNASDHLLPQRYFLFVGRLAPEKNVVTLLKAWLAYRGDGGAWGLVFAGDGPEGPALQQILKSSHFADDVFLLGHKTSQELKPIFSFATCFVLPSSREPWGLVVNEAMAAGLPVIVSDRCGCAADLIQEGRNGLIFDPANPEELRACLHLVSELSAEQLSSMGQSSGERIQPYSPVNFGREIALIADAARRPSSARMPSTPERVA